MFGTYDSRIAYGQSRVLVAWNRIVYPDGSSVTLGTMPGADMSGYAGFHDQVNNHYFRIFGSAFLMSAIIGTTAYTIDKMDDDENGNYYSDKPDLKKEMVTALAQQMSTTAMQMIQRNMNIAPGGRGCGSSVRGGLAGLRTGHPAGVVEVFRDDPAEGRGRLLVGGQPEFLFSG